MFANMVLRFVGIDSNKKTGNMTEIEIKKLDEVIRAPAKFGAPPWMLNQRSAIETGETSHLLMSDLRFTTENDIKRLKKTKAYRGIRHIEGQPTKGQRTKSNFRKNKGKVMGVSKKKDVKQQAPEKK
jgi:small subunit ribosomal protein S13